MNQPLFALSVLSVLAFGTSALASPIAVIQNESWAMANCGSPNPADCYATPTNNPPAARPKDYTGSTFAYNIKDGSWWASFDSFRGYDARAKCDADSKARYDYFWCNHDTKKGKKPMIVALGYDNAHQRYRMVSNASSRQNNPERILKDCQNKGYTDCTIVWDGK